MQNLRLKEKKKRKALRISVKKTTFSVNSKRILINVLQVNSGKIKMTPKPYICADIYIFMSPHVCGCVQLSLE